MAIQRTIRFYELVNSSRERFPSKFPFDDLREAVMDLPDDAAYVSLSRMELLGSSYDPSPSGARPAVPLFMLDRITRDVRLRIERNRNYRPLVLDADETLAEPAFYSIFDRNVLAVMRNSGSAPGASSFRDYINKLRLVEGDVNLDPLVDGNGLRALADVGTLTKLNIRVGPDVNEDVFGSTRTLYESIRSMRRSLGAVGIEVAIRIAPKGQHEESQMAYEDVESLFDSQAFGYMDKAEISYRSIENGRARTHDFIQEAVATSWNVELSDTTHQPTELSVAQAMSEAYEERYDDIQSALESRS